MYIKSVIIDGFKSYAQRTEINGFDEQFNAITGLNGSGKSNILDAICFLLGITNLSQVRAASMQDLVYKSGQAGVTKATVSIVFDNTDKAASPLGYDQFDELTITRQIVIGGKNRYLINGSNAPNNRVHDLFRSVQLNVNNPHFLIMQGRITKVLNMKPPEILSLLEEAVGTKLYEHKREQTQKTIEQKDFKLREIDGLLKSDINPTLIKLRKEIRIYQEYQETARELEFLHRFMTAYRYVSYLEQKEKANVEYVEINASIQALMEQKEDSKIKVDQLEEEINELCMERDRQGTHVLEELDKLLSDKLKRQAVLQSSVTAANQSLEEELHQRRELEKTVSETEKLFKNKQKQFETIRGSFQKLTDHYTRAQSELEAAEKHLQDLHLGFASNEDGQAATLDEQLRISKKNIADSESQIRQCEIRLKHLNGDLKTEKQQLSKMQNNAGKEQKEMENVKASIDSLQREMSKLNVNVEEEQQLNQRYGARQTEMRQLRDQIDSFRSRNPNVDFECPDNLERNFDKRRVKGTIASLIKIKDPKFATALEIFAGGKLYNVVVDTEHTAKLILEKGQLAKKTTFIPLNKISARTIPQVTADLARRIVGRDQVFPALELVEYSIDVAKAVEFAFGSGFIAVNQEVGKTVAFHRDIYRRCVTLDGDDFNPSGTLSGGYRGNHQPVLMQVQPYVEQRQRLNHVTSELHKLNTKLQETEQQSNKYHDLQRRLDNEQHQLNMLRQKIGNTEYHRLAQHIEEMEQQITEQQGMINDHMAILEKERNKVAMLEDRKNNAAAIRERELKEAAQRINVARQNEEESRNAVASRQNDHDTLAVEIEELTKECDNYRMQLEAGQATLAEKEETVRSRQDELDEFCHEVDAAKQNLNSKKEEIKQRDSTILEKQNAKKKLENDICNCDLKITDLKHKLANHGRDAADAEQRVEELLANHTWILSESKHFGQPGGHYDFQKINHRDQAKKIAKLEERKETLSKKVNMRAMNMLNDAETQCHELNKKRQAVLTDKQELQRVMEECDRQKKVELMTAYDKVNSDFGQLFSTVLPGSFAKLVPPKGKTVLDGLEFRIRFGEQWKESLTELSGGQRSLVALSLILSLLRFKPAPLYILDEVDAALDLSHTQNIGHLIKNYFTNSQFIVVSLQDNMFNNANVLFKTKFVDGVSTVTRNLPFLGEQNICSQQVLSQTKRQKYINNSTGKKRKHIATMDDSSSD